MKNGGGVQPRGWMPGTGCLRSSELRTSFNPDLSGYGEQS